MANYSTLKAAVADVVKTNGAQAITGANLQSVLLSIINSVGGGGYIFAGVATPSTNPGTPDQNVFYIGGAGTYANFGTSVTVPVGSIGVFKYNGSWVKEQIKMFEQTELITPLNKLDGYSPYYVDTIIGAWMTGSTINTNEYTGPYRVSLFRLPAGMYEMIPMSALSATVIYVGTISSESNFVVGGTISEILVKGTDTEKKIVNFSEETLVCLLWRNNNYAYFCDASKAEYNADAILSVDNKIKNTLSYTQNGLLGVKKGTTLVNITPNNNGDIITSDLFSQFFLDMKIIGDVETGTEYMFDLYHQRLHGTTNVANYIRISKSSNNWATRTTVADKQLGLETPTGMILHEFTPTNSTLTKIYLLLNWDALSNCNTKTDISNYGQYLIPLCYKFEMSYLKNMDYGIIPNMIKSDITLPYTQNGLLGIKKGNKLPSITARYAGDVITNTLFSQFFMDMKIVGDVESNTEYRVDYMQLWHHGYDINANYIRIVKSSNNWSSTTTIVSQIIGQDAPTGMILYEFIPTNTTLTKIYLLLNWDALSNFNTGTAVSTSGRYDIPIDYMFSVEYMKNMEYGAIPSVLAYRNSSGLSERVDIIEEAVYENVNIDDTSPYYVDELSNAWMQQGTIKRNEYTGVYRIMLFRLPAGKYQLDNKGRIASNTVILVGSIASEEDLVVDGVISYTYLVASSTPNSIRIELSSETLVVMLANVNSINYYSAVGALVVADWQEEINDIFKVDLDVVIPDTVYAIVGTEMNIWNDTISLSVDKGLHSPANYSVLWSCNKGLITDRCFRFTPTASDVGNVSCTCTVYDMRGVLVTSKTFTIKVLANNALSSTKNIVYFGDSLGQAAANCLYANFHNSDRFAGTIPNMLGTMGTTAHCEAVGGYKWSSYATEGVIGYRVYVSGVTALSVGAVYSDGQHNFEIFEVNITDGTGNCLLARHYTSAGTLIMPSGTLTKVSGAGDNTIPYTGAYEESTNPLWNDTTQQLDINQYKQTLVNLGQLPSTSAKIDAVSFQLGINDHAMANQLNTLKGYITSLYNLFINDNANCKFILGITTSCGDDVNGSGANYGATWNWKEYVGQIYKINKFYLSLLAQFPNMRIATPNLYLDRYYGYAFSTRQISDRYTETEQYHNNYVHPASSGYYQMADAYLAAYVAVLTE